jgi:MoxR-like ATPase
MPSTPYSGDRLRTMDESTPLGIEPYLPSPSLVKAVQLAQILQRPLLVKGEPGCGKSRLAAAIAAEFFGAQYGKDFKDYYFEWNIKSSSKAQDGLYKIDNLKRLGDANVKGLTKQKLEISLEKDDKTGRYKAKGNYIELGYLGQAFVLSQDRKLKNPPVVLIDEIDKADIDFPNDLLLELDRMEFDIPEIKDKQGKPLTIQAHEKLRPLIIITSNDEKALPPAFLRRCLFHYIDFSEIKLNEIVAARFPVLNKEDPGLVGKAVDAFKAWRKLITEKATGDTTISTSELLDWVKLIDHYRPLEKIDTDFKPDKLPPFHQALLKNAELIRIFVQKNPAAATAPDEAGAIASAAS